MRPGDVVAERFLLESIAGQGGMGVVFRALDRATGKPVALKVMTLHVAGAVARFDREARLLASLDHPGIVRYVAHGAEQYQPWLAMEWLDGEDLSARLFREGLSIADAVTLIRHAAGAVGVAHRAGIVHRDLKPQNLFLVERDPKRVKVLDFGIARQAFAQAALTQPGMVLGTPAYMAPEQASGHSEVGPAADVWSLGAMLFECVSGRPPFQGDLPIAVLMKALVEQAPRLSDVSAGVPAGLEALVAKMLARDPAARFPDAGAVAHALYELRLGPTTGRVSAPPREPAPSAITGAEQELIAVVLAMPDLAAGGTLVEIREPARTPTIPNVAQLVDGSWMVVLRGAGYATDLAAQAARAALELSAKLGPRFKVALATGRARRGADGVPAVTPSGEAVDRAASLASTGAAGAVVIDELTLGLLPAAFVTERAAHGVLLVEERAGDDAPVRTLLGKPTPCVGRKKELRILEAVLDAAFEERTSQAALLLGPAGCGKTRLRHELAAALARAHPEAEVWIGRGDPVAAGSSFGVITRALAAAIGLREGDPLEARRERIRARVDRHVAEAERARVAEFLGELLGAPFEGADSLQLRAARADLQLMGDQLRRAVLDLLDAQTSSRPLLVVIEDLQWGDLPSVSLLEAALARLGERPLMVLATARPEVDERLVAPLRARGLEQLALAPLPRRAAEELAAHVLGERATPAVVERLVERAEGNAFFLEELLRAEAEGRGGELPPTLVAVAQARLEALDAPARRILRAASVTGLTFWPGCVRAILGGDTPALDAWLETLTRAELVEPRPQARFAGEREHAFRQDVVREAAYLGLTEADRATAHLLAAGWLEAASQSDPAVVAQHFERAQQPERARGHWVRAAAQALEGQDLDAARAFADRALAAGAEGELAGRAHHAKAEAASWQLQYEPALAAAREAVPLLPRGGAPFFEAATVAVACASAMGRHDETARFVDAMLAAPRDRDPAAAAVALATAASHLLYAGDPDGAARASEAARQVATRCSGDAAVLAKLALLGAREANFRGDTGGYAQQLAASRMLFEAAGDLRRTLNQQSNVGYALLELGRYEESERELSAALRRADETGNTRVAAFARHNLGMVLAMLGRYAEGAEAERRAIEELRAGGHARLEAGSRVYLARILELGGELDAALREALAAVEQLREVAPPLRPLAFATLASVHLRRGEPAEALAAAREAMGAESIEAGESLVRLAYAEALHAGGQRAEARAAIAEAAARLRERADKIHDAGYRDSFLTRVPENARTLALAAAWAAPVT
ncbi:MAG: protein kinase [Sandaracinaceae bacterium]|nr:protein kinase [Sandaracinaceae bacterium]